MPSFALRWRPALWLLGLALLGIAAARFPTVWNTLPGHDALSMIFYALLILLGWPFLLGAQLTSLLVITVGMRDLAAIVSAPVGWLTAIGFYLIADRKLTKWAKRQHAGRDAKE